MFELKQSNFDTIQRHDIHYLYADSNMFGDCKFGDLMLYSTYLYFLKRYLITYYPDKFNQDNLFFIFNKRTHTTSLQQCFLSKIKGEAFLPNINPYELRSVLMLFNKVWGGMEVNESGKYNIRQIVSGGNIWSFKTYLDENKITIPITEKIIDPSKILITHNKRNKIIFNPVRGKKYNIERNMDDDEIIKIINECNVKDTINLVTKGTDINFKYIKDNTRNRLVNYDSKYSWDAMLLDIFSDCKLYIGGDCGFTHFVSLIDIKYKPEMMIYYRTRDFMNKVKCNEFDRDTHIINFMPYKPYENDTIKIIKER